MASSGTYGEKTSAPRPSPRDAVLFLIGGLAVGLRVLWLVLLPVPPESDYATFLAMAEAIAAGSWDPDSYGWLYQGFGYPLLLAPVVALGGGVSALGLVNLVLQLVLVVVVALLTLQLLDGRSAVIAATATAVMPGIWSYVPLLAAESLGMLLLAAVALLLAMPPGRGRAASIGALVMLLAFARPSFMPFVPVVAIAMALRGGVDLRRRLVAFAAGVVVVLLPIVALNLYHGGPALPVGAAGWQTWLVNNEHATGAWFNAAADDAYPFHGLIGDAEIRAAQSKLGLQFIAVNPVEALQGLAHRHELNWRSDVMGIGWTLDRAPADWQERVPFRAWFDDLAQIVYVGIMILALMGAVRHRNRASLYVPVILPLLYGIAVLAVAEGNARYHAVYLPLLCVLAGAAFARGISSARSYRTARARGLRLVARYRAEQLPWKVGLPVTGIVLLVLAWLLLPGVDWWRKQWDSVRFDLPPLLVIGIVAVPVISGVVALVRRSWAGWMVRLSVPSWRVRAVVAAGLLIAAIASLAAVQTALEWRAEVAAVSPDGWHRTLVSRGEVVDAPLILEHSGTPPELRQVSFPDAALLQFDAEPEPDDRVELWRTLDGLERGETYVFYLQVYDPGIGGDQTEHLHITLNGDLVWERASERMVLPRWHYVRVEWEADRETVDIVVTREAGREYRVTEAAIPRVRTLHLYPLY